MSNTVGARPLAVKVRWVGDGTLIADDLFFSVRLGIGAILLWAGLEKATAFRAFASGIVAYRLIPRRFINAVATALIAAELAFGFLLVSGVLLPIAAGGAIGLFAIFVVVLAVSLARRTVAPCHCFGASDSEVISFVGLARAILLLLLAVWSFAMSLQDPSSPDLPAALAGLTIAAAVVAIARLLGFVDQAWRFLTAPAELYPTPTRRVSLRYEPVATSSSTNGERQPSSDSSVVDVYRAERARSA